MLYLRHMRKMSVKGVQQVIIQKQRQFEAARALEETV